MEDEKLHNNDIYIYTCIKFCYDFIEYNEDYPLLYEYLEMEMGKTLKLEYLKNGDIDGYSFKSRYLQRVLDIVKYDIGLGIVMEPYHKRPKRLESKPGRTNKPIGRNINVIKDEKNRRIILTYSPNSRTFLRRLIKHQIVINRRPQFFERAQVWGYSIPLSHTHDLKSIAFALGYTLNFKTIEDDPLIMFGRYIDVQDKIPETGIRIFLNYSEKHHMMTREPGYTYRGVLDGMENIKYKSNFKVQIPGFLIPKKSLPFFEKELKKAKYEYHLIMCQHYVRFYERGGD
jgi:hypothetical protein